MKSPAELLTLLPAFEVALAEKDYSRLSVVQYRSRVRLCLTWLLENGMELEPRSVIAYRDGLQKAGSRPRTVRTALNSLRCWTLWLEEAGHAGDLSKLRAIKAPPLDDPVRYMPTDEEIRALFAAAARLPGFTLNQRFERARMQAVLALLCYTGVRRDELLGLNRGDIVERALPHLPGKPPPPKRFVLDVRYGKNRASRSIPLSAECLELVQPYLKLRDEWMEEGEAIERTEAMFPAARRNNRLDDDALRALLRTLLCLAGLESSPITPHCLRAWFITRAAEKKDIPTAAALAGHRSQETTIKHYLKSSKDRQLDAVDAISLAPQPPEPRFHQRRQDPMRRSQRAEWIKHQRTRRPAA